MYRFFFYGQPLTTMVPKLGKTFFPNVFGFSLLIFYTPSRRETDLNLAVFPPCAVFSGGRVRQTVSVAGSPQLHVCCHGSRRQRCHRGLRSQVALTAAYLQMALSPMALRVKRTPLTRSEIGRTALAGPGPVLGFIVTAGQGSR